MALDFPNKKYANNILQYMQKQKYVITAYNIVYIEGVEPDTLALNDDTIDKWNDVRAIITDDGEWLLCAVATTEPGSWYTYQPMNPRGAARIAFGQYLDAWEFGLHGRYLQEALVQCANITVYRDKNEDGMRIGDQKDTGMFGINQHTTIDAPSTIGHWSAGCLVGRYPSTHAKFIQLCRESGRKRFHTTVLDGTLLHKEKVLGNISGN